MKKLTSLLLAFLFAFTSPVVADDRTVLVELFTSQGCSSCPPADAYMHTLAERDDVVALAMHVDYWDYIGWKDSFAQPEFTTRQREYARVGERRMIYTPQMIINGSDHVVGNRPKDANDLIQHHKENAQYVDVMATRQDDRLSVNGYSKEGAEGQAVVQLMRYRPSSTVEITRGENAGRTLTYANVVTEIVSLAEWDLSQPLSLDVAIEGNLPAVIVIQRGSHGPVEAAVKVN